MEKLEQLKQMVGEWFKEAQDKSVIDKLSTIKNACDEVEKEQTELQTKHSDLLKDYKELVNHTSFKDMNNQPKDNVGGGSISFEAALEEFMKKEK